MPEPTETVANEMPSEAECPHCGKPPTLCICAEVRDVDNRIEVLILQHPQEQDKTLGSARLAAHQLKRAKFKIGLSWPSLSKALGREVDPKRWGILHLGSITGKDFPPGLDIAVFDGKGQALAEQKAALKGLEGVVLFDGTWAQAKTLWWRNPWVLKARRIALKPAAPSLYGRLRKEPRREGLSTIEAVGLVLSRLEGKPDIDETLKQSFMLMLTRYKMAKKAEGGTRASRDPETAPKAD
ncbi:MAG: DTW domain-containing protein [Ancalomicrobiaceae bacterium]|nr:DTW domain-containing protein [Ancalomicrobiaceae bacterium]